MRGRVGGAREQQGRPGKHRVEQAREAQGGAGQESTGWSRPGKHRVEQAREAQGGAGQSRAVGMSCEGGYT